MTVALLYNSELNYYLYSNVYSFILWNMMQKCIYLTAVLHSGVENSVREDVWTQEHVRINYYSFIASSTFYQI